MTSLINNALISSDRRKKLYACIAAIFTIWPCGSLFLVFKYWRTSWAKNIFWLFCIYFGLTFVIDSTGESDSSRYGQELLQFSQSGLTLNDLKSSIYGADTNYVDIVQPLITFIVSKFTDNPKVLFTVFALIFGFFYSRNIWYILDRLNNKITFIILIFIIVYALLNPIFNINGFRMYAAAHIFLYGTLPFLLEGNKKKLFWAFFSVFVHFSFFLPVFILICYILFGNRLGIYFWFFIVACFFSEINIQTARESLAYLPGVFSSRLELYFDADYISSLSQSQADLSWYMLYYIKLKSWILIALSVLVFVWGKNELKSRPDLLNLFCFALLICGWAKLLGNLPSAGRFGIIANLFMFAFFILFFSEHKDLKFYKELEFISIPILLLFIIVTIRMGLDFMGLSTILGNPVYSYFVNDNIPLVTVIKQLF